MCSRLQISDFKFRFQISPSLRPLHSAFFTSSCSFPFILPFFLPSSSQSQHLLVCCLWDRTSYELTHMNGPRTHAYERFTNSRETKILALCTPTPFPAILGIACFSQLLFFFVCCFGQRSISSVYSFFRALRTF